MFMKVRFIKDYLIYKIGEEFINIDKINGLRLIALGVCKEIKPRKSIRETILTK